MKIAVISAILEEPTKCNAKFNEVISAFGEKSKDDGDSIRTGVSVVSVVVIGELNEINSLTGKLEISRV